MQSFLLVGAGGALGAMARYGTNIWIGSLDNGFPLSTLTINIVGSLAMGLLVGILARTTPEYQNEIRLFVAVGIFGGFTTFSSFSLDAIVMAERGQLGLAALYVLLSVALSLVALLVGLSAIRWVPV